MKRNFEFQIWSARPWSWWKLNTRGLFVSSRHVRLAFLVKEFNFRPNNQYLILDEQKSLVGASWYFNSIYVFLKLQLLTWIGDILNPAYFFSSSVYPFARPYYKTQYAHIHDTVLRTVYCTQYKLFVVILFWNWHVGTTLVAIKLVLFRAYLVIFIKILYIRLSTSLL